MNFIVGRMIISDARTSWPVRTIAPRRGKNPSRWRNVAQGSLSSPSADGRLSHRAVLLTGRIREGFQITWFEVRPGKRSADLQVGICAVPSGADLKVSATAARQEPASQEEPSAIKIGGPTTAGPALQAGCIIWVGLAPSEGQSNR